MNEGEFSEKMRCLEPAVRVGDTGGPNCTNALLSFKCLWYFRWHFFIRTPIEVFFDLLESYEESYNAMVLDLF
jgi:hypothetical protein